MNIDPKYSFLVCQKKFLLPQKKLIFFTILHLTISNTGNWEPVDYLHQIIVHMMPRRSICLPICQPSLADFLSMLGNYPNTQAPSPNALHQYALNMNMNFITKLKEPTA